MRPCERAKQIFTVALELPSAERNAFVADACAGDQALLREVRSLLAYHQDDAASADTSPSAGASLPDRIGPYRVVGRIGEGGMGRVLIAEDGDGRPVALKLLRRELMTDDLVARFSREADALTRLDHAGIARLLGSGVQPTPAGPQHWLALEYIGGVKLGAWAATLPSEEARLALIARLCDALQHAHEHRVVYRDLKPENVIVREDGQPVLLDFGIARFTDADLRVTVALTRTGLLLGTVRYMSPERSITIGAGRGGRVFTPRHAIRPFGQGSRGGSAAAGDLGGRSSKGGSRANSGAGRNFGSRNRRVFV